MDIDSPGVDGVDGVEHGENTRNFLYGRVESNLNDVSTHAYSRLTPPAKEAGQLAPGSLVVSTLRLLTLLCRLEASMIYLSTSTPVPRLPPACAFRCCSIDE